MAAADFIWMSRGTSNGYLLTSEAGEVVVNTGAPAVRIDERGAAGDHVGARRQHLQRRSLSDGRAAIIVSAGRESCKDGGCDGAHHQLSRRNHLLLSPVSTDG